MGSTLFASLKVLCNPLPRWVHDKYSTTLLALSHLWCLTFQRLDLSIDFGHDKEYYEELVKEQSFEPLNLEVRKINDEMNLWVYQLLVLYDVVSNALFRDFRILNEADYQKHKEIDYHEQTVSMNQAAMWFPMIQVSGAVLLRKTMHWISTFNWLTHTYATSVV
jgi:hypothetical protein